MAEEKITVGGREFVRISRFGVVEDHLEEGPPASSYRHVQGEVQPDWLINHGLGFKPSVTCIRTDGGTFSGTITHLSDSVLSIHFSLPVMGEAHLT